MVKQLYKVSFALILASLIRTLPVLACENPPCRPKEPIDPGLGIQPQILPLSDAFYDPADMRTYFL